MKPVVILSATLTILIGWFAFQAVTEVEEVRYILPKGFIGDWYVVEDLRLKDQFPQRRYALRFDSLGICRVDKATFDRIAGPTDRKCVVGSQVVEMASPMDFKEKALSCFSTYEWVGNPELARAIPGFYYGFVGDLNDLKRLGSDTVTLPSEKLKKVLARDLIRF